MMEGRSASEQHLCDRTSSGTGRWSLPDAQWTAPPRPAPPRTALPANVAYATPYRSKGERYTPGSD